MAYIILCADNTFCTGITNDIVKRMAAHADGRGVRYFRGRKTSRDAGRFKIDKIRKG
ncbi:MAG: GIY-YIG nuclease family protein [Deltaproteobacteria bacterium]|nr:GIY-YIG nuclease family protein [Deltaproteobacteria bacterium]MBT6503899.1 GIY-YIG nuclease family protein [Deltaproteobacteria bacterium]MBT7154514.1 GIY-YIG nuclease family protein [Deltaproteobacteria bacterium]MBT7712533.1 GIY-YIG nuclease family protein [Deltaproteobacteria bacterium]